MTYLIRPRQDFTLARLSEILAILDDCGFEPEIARYMNAVKDEKKAAVVLIVHPPTPEYREGLYLNEYAIKKICELGDFSDANFKILEVRE